METARARGRAVASAGGRVLAAAVRALAASRPAAKPMHPRGDLETATLSRAGAEPPTGAAWLDEPGVDEVLVRRSRSIGLPPPLPDVHGLALRVPAGDGHGDLLLANTGRSRLGRFLLTVARTPRSGFFSTLLPYRTPSGPVLIGAQAVDERRFRLLWAPAGGPWRPFGELELSPREGRDALVSFDPVGSTPPGLDNYPWVRRLREPSYRAARRARRGW